MSRARQRGMSIVEVMVGAAVLLICTPPILRCVVWMRSCAADTTVDSTVTAKLNEQVAIARSFGRSTPLVAGTTNTSSDLGGGVTLSIVRTVSAVSGKPRLFDVLVTGTWVSKTQGGQNRSLTVETNVFSPDN